MELLSVKPLMGMCLFSATPFSKVILTGMYALKALRAIAQALRNQYAHNLLGLRLFNLLGLRHYRLSLLLLGFRRLGIRLHNLRHGL
jgi:hypothetical protein